MPTFFFLTLSLALSSSFCIDAARPKKVSPLIRIPCKTIEAGPATIYIHGTLFQTQRHATTPRRGLYHYSSKDCPESSREYIDRALHLGNPTQFPQEHFYKFYWSGKLHSVDRKKAAEDLLSVLEVSKGPITIIAHSHGCNVALVMGEIAQQRKKTSALVDRLILLAPPVQEATSTYVNSPIFKRVYSLYSTADVAQVVDPQIWYSSTTMPGHIFSKRTFAASPKLLQARVLIIGQSPGHQDFIQPRFFKQLFDIIDLLDRAQSQGTLQENCCINIPFQSKAPYILKKPYTYSPRRINNCSCTRK